jgi:hypothetical protein
MGFMTVWEAALYCLLILVRAMTQAIKNILQFI